MAVFMAYIERRHFVNRLCDWVPAGGSCAHAQASRAGWLPRVAGLSMVIRRFCGVGRREHRRCMVALQTPAVQINRHSLIRGRG